MFFLTHGVEPSHWVCKPALFGVCPEPRYVGRVVTERAFSIKMAVDGGWGTDSPNVVESRQVVSV